MRATEFLSEGFDEIPNAMPDGDVILTHHLKDRLALRKIDLARVLHLLKRAGQRNKKDLLALGDHASFILDKPELDIAILKIWHEPKQKYNYIVRTAHPTVKVGPGQTQIKVNEQ